MHDQLFHELKTKSLLPVLLSFVILLPVNAALLFEDSFSSISGNYSYTNDGTPTSTLGPNLTYTGLASSGGSYDFSIFQTNSTAASSTATNDTGFTDEFLDNSDVIYFSALFQVPDLAAFGNDGGSVYAGFDGTGVSFRSYGLGLEVDDGGIISYSADTGGGVLNLGGTVTEGQTVLMIGRITGWPDSTGYFPPSPFEYVINPDLSQGEPASWSTVSASGNINKMTATQSYLRVNAFTTGWNDDNDARFLVDEHRVGTTWDDVTPAAIPEPTTLGLLTFIFAILRICRIRCRD